MTSGIDARTEKFKELEVPPPGSGVKTVTGAVPGTAMSTARIAALNWVALRNVGGRSAPFQRTTESEANPVPPTVRLNPLHPA